MELYMRLIEEGVFVFWNDEGEHAYDLTISIFVGDKKMPIVRKRFEGGERSFSLSKIGAGDYEIELKGYEGDRLFQTEKKKCIIKSTSQQNAEIIEKLDSIEGSIDDLYDGINCTQGNLQGICNWISKCEQILNRPDNNLDARRWADFIRQIK